MIDNIHLLAEENNWVPAAVFGGLLFVAGAVMMSRHRSAWNKQRSDATLDEQERTHYANRFSRRMQTSAGISIVGALVALGDQAVIWNLGPLASTLYWIVVMVLAVWIAILAFGDMTSIKTHSTVTRAKFDAQRRQLENELAKHRKQSTKQ